MVKKENFPKWEEFGDIFINPGELHFKNKLVVVAPNKKRMNGFTTKQLSNPMAKILTQIQY